VIGQQIVLLVLFGSELLVAQIDGADAPLHVRVEGHLPELHVGPDLVLLQAGVDTLVDGAVVQLAVEGAGEGQNGVGEAVFV